MAGKRQTLKAQMTCQSLIVAAAVILREQGPSSVTYRKVAEKAGAASSSVGYYFDSIDDLLREAADFNTRLWAQRAEKAAEAAEALSSEQAHEQVVRLLLQACLPEEFSVPAAHYEQLMTAGQSEVVTSVYRRGRIRINAAIARILDHAGIGMLNPHMVVAIVDGAAVVGISEGYPVRDSARDLLTEFIQHVYKFAHFTDQQSSDQEK